ncbi:MAG: hypothetical protein CM15mP52_1730 [Candidatus Neomarinimicrobiota bacterium]|nr:MAG: hypothetical protein CM15mP52_1730 [Candidatus Neomarinimicrobiota bacterium]
MSMGCLVWKINQMENKENKKLNLISLGCAKNLVDSEILLGGLNKTNIDLTDDPDKGRHYCGKYLWIFRYCQRRVCGHNITSRRDEEDRVPKRSSW